MAVQINLSQVFDDFGLEANSKFMAFHKKYPEIYEMFKKITFEAMKKGFKNYGAKGIVELIRWRTKGEVKSDGYKINNNYTSYYVRLFEHEHPQYIGFFRKRSLKS